MNIFITFADHRHGSSGGRGDTTATRTVDWLVENGYVQRLADPEDRRVVRVELTEGGKELHQAMNGLRLEGAKKFLPNFSREESKELGCLLGKLVDNLD